MDKENSVSKDKLLSSAVCRDESKVESIHSAYAKDPDFTDLLEDFAEGLSERIHKMQEALRHDDLGQVEDLAHKLKGAAGFAGYPTLSEAAKALEDIAAKGGDVETANSALSELHLMCKRVLRGIPSKFPRGEKP